jgi:hypothetical protein
LDNEFGAQAREQANLNVSTSEYASQAACLGQRLPSSLSKKLHSDDDDEGMYNSGNLDAILRQALLRHSVSVSKPVTYADACMTDHNDDKDGMHSSSSLSGLALLERDVAVMELELVLSSGASVLDPIMAVYLGVDTVDPGGLSESELDKIHEDELDMFDVDDADMLDTDDLEDREMLVVDDDERAEQHDDASVVSHNRQEDIGTLFSGNMATANAHTLGDGILSLPSSPSR